MYSRSFSKVALLLGVAIIIALPIGVLIKSLPQAQISDTKPERLVLTAVFSAGSVNDLRDSERAILKDALDGLPAISYMGFGATSAQEAVMMIVFDQGADRKAAVANVQERINAVQRKLPILTNRGGALVIESVLSRLIFIDIRGPNSRQGQQIVDNDSLIHLLPELNQIPGVAGSMILSGRSYVIRLKLNRDRMRRWAMTADQAADITDATMLGPRFEETGSTSQWIEYARVTRYPQRTPEEDGGVILKEMPDGQIVHFRDVGQSEICPLYYEASESPEGPFSATIVLTRLPDASSDVVMKAVRQKINKIKTTSLSPDMSIDVNDKLPANQQP